MPHSPRAKENLVIPYESNDCPKETHVHTKLTDWFIRSPLSQYSFEPPVKERMLTLLIHKSKTEKRESEQYAIRILEPEKVLA